MRHSLVINERMFPDFAKKAAELKPKDKADGGRDNIGTLTAWICLVCDAAARGEAIAPPTEQQIDATLKENLKGWVKKK